MIRVFLDTNVLVDVLNKREPFVHDSAEMIDLGCLGMVKLYTSALSFATCLYLIRKSLGKENAVFAIRSLRRVISISPMNETEFDAAFSSDATDYEDMLQYYSALAAACDVVVTRNKQHFPQGGIPIKTPTEFLDEQFL